MFISLKAAHTAAASWRPHTGGWPDECSHAGTVELRAEALAKQLNQVRLDGCVHQVVFQQDLSACGIDTEGCLVVSVPPLIDSQVLPYPVELRGPERLADLAQRLSSSGSMVKLSYDMEDPSLMLNIRDEGPFGYQVRPQSEEFAAGHRGWMIRVLHPFSAIEAIVLDREWLEHICDVCRDASGQLLELSLSSAGSYVTTEDRPDFTADFPLKLPPGVPQLHAGLPADRLLAALRQLEDAKEIAFKFKETGATLLTDGSAVHLLWPFQARER